MVEIEQVLKKEKKKMTAFIESGDLVGLGLIKGKGKVVIGKQMAWSL